MLPERFIYESNQNLIDYIHFLFKFEPTIKLVVGTSTVTKIKKDERDNVEYSLKLLKYNAIDNLLFLHTPYHRFNLTQLYSQFDGYENFRFQEHFPPKSNEDYHYVSGTFIDIYIPIEKSFDIPPQFAFPCDVNVANLYFQYYLNSTFKSDYIE